jgi:uncharacterized protein
MLIEFSVSNYRSFRERQVLSLAATASKELLNNTCRSGIRNLAPLLRTIAVYGPNAAGKTNLVRAVLTMQQAVLLSAGGQVGAQLPLQPFALTRETASAPTAFEVHFIHKGIRYQYNFAATPSQIVGESLTAYPSGRPQLWFERKLNPGANKTHWTFGKKLKGKPRVWSEATRSNALFLSTAVQLNSTQLKPVFEWFQEYLICVIPGLGIDLNPYLTYEHFLSGPEGKAAVLAFLNVADLRMKDIDVKREPFNLGPQQAVPKQKGDVIATGPGKLEFFSARSFHPLSDAKGLASFSMSEESLGTQKLFRAAGGYMRTLRTGATLIVDEIENSLHPLIVRFLIAQFHDKELNKNCGQLIFTTHETSALTNDLLRRDQVWFVERTKNESTKLYSLSDFKARKEEPFAKNYLQGRYGALPVVGSFSTDGR